MKTLLLTLLLSLVTGSLAAQRPSAVSTIPISDLTLEELWALPDEQLISSEQGRITLGELRSGHRRRQRILTRTAGAVAAQTARELRALRAALADRAPQCSEGDGERVKSMVAHLSQRDVANPEAVRRARALVAQRHKAYGLWLKRRSPLKPSEYRKIERQLREIRRVTAAPVR